MYNYLIIYIELSTENICVSPPSLVTICNHSYFLIDIIILLEIPWSPWQQVDVDMLHSLSCITPILYSKSEGCIAVHLVAK